MCQWMSDVSVIKWEMWMTYYIDNWLCVVFIVYTSLSSYFYFITYWFSSAFTFMIFNSLSQQSHVSLHLFFLIVNFRYTVLEMLFNASFTNLLFINLLFVNLLFINLLKFSYSRFFSWRDSGSIDKSSRCHKNQTANTEPRTVPHTKFNYNKN